MPLRRRFTADYKRRILRETDACGPGELAALLRREGLYSSHLTTWRRQRRQGEREALAPKPRGRKTVPRNRLTAENERLRRENDRLQQRLKQAETIIECQKKLSDVLGIPLASLAKSEHEE
jgi:transposase-like protein